MSATPGPDAPSADSSARHAGWASFGITTAVLLVVGMVAMGDAVLECTSVVRGRPNDGTSGAVWLNWAWEQTGGGPFASVQYVTGGNLGDVLWRPLLVVNVGILAPMWALAQIVGPVCGYNLTFLFGYVTSGLGMWALARHLVPGRVVPTVAAVLFAFTSFTQLKAEWGHTAGVFLVLFPVLVLTVVRLWERVTPGRLVAAGLCWGALPYVDGYFLAFALVLVIGLVAGMSISIVRRSRRSHHPMAHSMAHSMERGVEPDEVVGSQRGVGRWVLGRLVATAAAGGVALVALVPWVLTLLSDFAAIDEQTSRGADDAVRYGARLWEYLLPSPRHPMAPEWYSTWRFENMHRSNVAETALYVGVVPAVLAVVALLAVRRSRHGRADADAAEVDHPTSPVEGARVDAPVDRTAVDAPAVDQPAVVAGLVGIVILAVVCSLSPDTAVFGIGLPMPSEAIRAVLPQVRVFSRLTIVVSTGLIALAAIGLHVVLDRQPQSGRRPSRRSMIAAGLTIAALFETLTFAPWAPPTWSYTRTPAVFAALAADDTVDTVALYPLIRAGENADVLPTYQPELGKVLVNAASDTGAVDDPADVNRGLAALSDPQSLPGLRMLGTDVVVLTSRGPEVAVTGSVPEGLVLESSTTCAPAVRGRTPRDADGRDCLASRVYRIGDGPVATAVLALGSGWGDFEAEGWGGTRSAFDGAQVQVVGPGSSDPVSVRFDVRAAGAAGRDGTVEVVDDAGSVVARVEIDSTSPSTSPPTSLAFVASPGETLTLRLTGVIEVTAGGFEVAPESAT